MKLKNSKNNVFSHILDIAKIIVGIFSAAFGSKAFLLPNEFIDGGATGISLLSSAISGAPFHILIIAINIPLVIMGLKTLGKTFALKTTIAVMGLAVILAWVEFPVVTHDKLLVAAFGGFFLGAGIGLAVRGGCVIDGIEILAIFLSKKTNTTIRDVVLFINIVIFASAAYFLGTERAMYSMITYLAASKTLNFVIEGIEEYVGVTIVSSQGEKIQTMISNKMGRGVTIYNGKKGYGKRGETNEIDILYTVITRLEINKLKRELDLIEPNAFVVMHSVKETKGGIIKQRPLNHGD